MGPLEIAATQPLKRSLFSQGSEFLELVGKIAVILVPTLYVLGRVYCETYWDDLGLSESLMQYSFEDRVYWGFYVLFSGLASILGWMPGGPAGMAFLMALTTVLVGLIAIIFHKLIIPEFKGDLDRAIEKIRVWRFGDRSSWVSFVRPVWGAGIMLQASLVYFLAVSLIIAVPLLVAIHVGHDGAARIVRKLDASTRLSGAIRMPIVHLKEPVGRATSAVLLQCSTEWCAVWAEAQFLAVRRESIEKVDACYQVGISQNGSVTCEWQQFRK